MKKPNERQEGGSLKPHPPELRERGYILYEKGKSNAQIAAELGIPVATLARWSSKGKWKLRRQLGTSETNDLATLPQIDDNLEQAEIDLLSFEEKQRRYADTMAASAVRFAETVKALSPQGLVASADKIAKLDQVARKALKLEKEKPRMAINIRMLAEGKIPRLQIASSVPANEAPSLLGDAGSNPANDSSDDARVGGFPPIPLP